MFISWHEGNKRTNKFKIEASKDKNTWNEIFEGQSNGSLGNLEKYEFPETSTKYLKIIGDGNSENDWVSIVNIQLDGQDHGNSLLSSQVTLKYPEKPSGQKITQVRVERSSHDGDTRDSFHSAPNKFSYSAVNDEMYGYFNVDSTNEDDEISFKKIGGEHTGDGNDPKTLWGRCYAIGVDFHGKPHIAKELRHPTTPKFRDQETHYADPSFTSLGALKKKTFGIKVISYVTPQNTYKAECWVDTSVLGTKLDDIQTPPNQWRLFYTCEDDGTWEYRQNGNNRTAGPPYLTNKAVEAGGRPMGFYIRIDNVGQSTKHKWVGATEIFPPTQ